MAFNVMAIQLERHMAHEVTGSRFSPTSQLWVVRQVNNNCMNAGGVLFFLVARAVCACIYVMVLLLLLC